MADKPHSYRFLEELEDWGGQQLPLVGCYIEDPPRKDGAARCWGIVTTRVIRWPDAAALGFIARRDT